MCFNISELFFAGKFCHFLREGSGGFAAMEAVPRGRVLLGEWVHLGPGLLS